MSELVSSFEYLQLICFSVFIHLMDENDNYPIIDFYPNDLPVLHGNTIKLSLSESLPVNSLILSFSIIDRDSGENGRVTWQLERGELLPFELIRLTDNTGELRTKRALDREYISEYNFTLEARDHGKPNGATARAVSGTARIFDMQEAASSLIHISYTIRPCFWWLIRSAA